ncbi:hypothetical protein BTUL_0032g00120 [Botrytis tulipae]|uniref:Uncharacterized protein n=1 Tax=Botrytis tulipae TaxID=87230 RepID=A0A4Z1EX25_9HELO|nr:hypothetical protein BTUL_0032g00120 [Botrytis tulipae]
MQARFPTIKTKITSLAFKQAPVKLLERPIQIPYIDNPDSNHPNSFSYDTQNERYTSHLHIPNNQKELTATHQLSDQLPNTPIHIPTYIANQNTGQPSQNFSEPTPIIQVPQQDYDNKSAKHMRHETEETSHTD